MIFGPAQSQTEEEQQQEGDSATLESVSTPELASSSPSSAPKTSKIAIDLHNCRLVCRYQDPLPGSNISVPGQVQDYFFVLKDMFIIELPRMSLNLPFLLENVDQGDGESAHGDDSSSSGLVSLLILENVELIMATTGVPGYYLLPMLRLPSVVVERDIVSIDSTSTSLSSTAAAARCQVLKVNAPCVDVGVHPSHLIIGTLAMQLLQQEFIALLAGNIGSEDAYTNLLSRARTPSPLKGSAAAGGQGQQRASELVTPREMLESESSDVFLSPPVLATPPSATASTPIAEASEHPAAAAPAILWRVETTVGLASLSLLGSLLTSTCLKFEWHRIYSTISNIPPAIPPAAAAGDSASLPLLASLTTTVGWSHLSVHVMRPKDTGDLMESYTPFHGMHGFFSTPQVSLGGGGGGGGGLGATGPGSVLSGAGEGAGSNNNRVGLHPLRPGVTPPSQIVPGIAHAAGAGLKRSADSFSASVGAADAQLDQEEQEPAAAISLNKLEHELHSPSMGSPSGTPSFADARSVMLSRFSGSAGGGGSVISRHFSVHESELFEDAASELLLPEGKILVCFIST